MSSNSEFKPFVPASESPRELTLRALVLGSLLGILFAASSVYLVLKVGMTVSASIPVAVLSITLFKYVGKFLKSPATILENNIVQTTGSAGESIAFGVGVTMPTLLLMGMEMELTQVLLVALLGGLLGVLMMIPLRESLIVREHGKLTYPEGTACADVLIVGEQGGTNAKLVFWGLGIGALYKFIQSGLKMFIDTIGSSLSFFKGASVAAEISPELLGVGYIIGPRVAGIMMAGGILSYLILIPAIAIFGEGLSSPIFPATTLIKDMSPNEIRSAYILYIGAGAVATGGIISLIRSLPTIWGAFKRGFESFKTDSNQSADKIKRTEQDLSMKIVIGGSLALLLAIWLAPSLQINLVSAILIMLFGFFFVTVSARITGEIGSSSNPISGMTVATLLITCLLFLAAGWTGVGYRAMALTTAAIVCIAASNGGTISQDLKTGYLVGATPKYQQIAIKVGVITSALVIGFTLIAINKAATTIVKRDYPAYTATLPADTRTEKAPDGKEYRVLYQHEAIDGVPTGKYLVNENNKISYLVDPGIGGTVTKDDEGRTVKKFDSPKSRLFSLIIDGILTQKLPWGLVLIGVALALMMEFCGVAALPFAVGIYLPISTSATVMIGGFIRYLVDRKRKSSGTDAEFSPGVLMSSGLIAGGAIMGVLLAFVAGSSLGENGLSIASYLGVLAESNLFAMLIFLAMVFTLYRVGQREA